MEAAVKKVMDGLFGGEVTFREALERLSVSEEKLHMMIDEYEYTSTTYEILESNRMMIENLEYIKKEISVNYRSGIPQNIIPTDATEILGKSLEPNSYLITDAANSMRQKELIQTSTADFPSYPHKEPYHW
ncbi:MAG: hypothetical protein WA130_11330 [Candidatus Methanoperedens sp.]